VLRPQQRHDCINELKLEQPAFCTQTVITASSNRSARSQRRRASAQKAASPFHEHLEADLQLRIESMRAVPLHDDRLLAPRHEFAVVFDVGNDLKELIWRVPETAGAASRHLVRSNPR
jgi:hypothetical protein